LVAVRHQEADEGMLVKDYVCLLKTFP